MKSAARLLAISTSILLASPPAIAGSAPKFEDQLRRAIVARGEAPERFFLADRMTYYKVPAVSVAIVEGCNIVQARSFGHVTTGGAAARTDTLFQVASISKPVTALAALRLVEQGKLSLDADARIVLKTWAIPDSPLLENHPVTLRRLLSHSAGFNVGGFRGYRDGTPLPTPVQILDGSGPANNDPVRIQTAPGSAWRYSGGGFVVAQLMMTDSTGKAFPALLHELVLAPLHMSNSTYEVPLPKRLHGKVAIAHGLDGEPVPGKWHTYPEMGAASLWSTPVDLARLAIAVMRAARGGKDTFITQATAADMLKSQIAHRGLGWVVGGTGRSRSFSHGGTNEGYGAQMMAFPDTCQGAVVLTNADGGRRLTSEVLRAIADAYRWPDPMSSFETQVVEMTPMVIARYVGSYKPKDRPDIPFDILEDRQGGLLLEWTRRPAEPLRASASGLLALDSGVVFKLGKVTAGRAQTLIFGDDGSYAERITQ